MKIEDLRRIKNQRPFMPFRIRMADGNEIEIKHPDALAWGDESPRLVYCISGNEHYWIDVALATAIVASNTAGPGGNGD